MFTPEVAYDRSAEANAWYPTARRAMPTCENKELVYRVTIVAMAVIASLGILGAMPLAATLPLLILAPVTAVLLTKTNFFDNPANVRCFIDLVGDILIAAREQINNIVVVNQNISVDNRRNVNVNGNNNWIWN